MATLEEQLILHEGIRLKAYKCPADKWTIGVGRNLEANPLTQAEVLEVLKDTGISAEMAHKWLDKKIKATDIQLIREFTWYRELDDIRKRVIIDMVFNIGMQGFKQFKNTILSIENKDYKRAAKEMLDSNWAKQVGQRANRLSKMMKTGEDYDT